MALIPLKNTVTIRSGGSVDAWGNPTYDSESTHKCRIDEKTELVRNQNGSEVVSNIQILIEKTVSVSYDDEISFKLADGKKVDDKPIAIGRLKDISGNVLFTAVSL